MVEHRDDDGRPIFTKDFTHRILSFQDICSEEVPFDLIESCGNLWFSGSDTLRLMGFPEHRRGGYGRTLRRISPPDIIKVKDTPFRFADGRRNRGSLISPMAVLQLAEGGTQNFNPIKAIGFVEWMNANLLTGGLDAEGWSPGRKQPVPLEPVFRAVIKVTDENQHGEALDPMRPIGEYQHIASAIPIAQDEVEFCLCQDERSGLGKCWCWGFGKIRSSPPAPFVPYSGDEVIDDGDVFSSCVNRITAQTAKEVKLPDALEAADF